jgi:protein subunit release factor A
MSKTKKLLFSVTAKDCIFETFCTGGKGGQHRNAKKNGVRCRHLASGAVTEHRDGRDQRKNKEAAFAKIAETKEFKRWHKAEVSRRLGQTPEIDLAAVEAEVDRQMAEKNLKVEEYDEISG